MRIFLAIPISPHPGILSTIWKSNLHDPLVEMGHEVVLWDEDLMPGYDLDPEAASTVALRAAFSERLVAAVEAAHRARPLDLVLTYLSDGHVVPEAVRQLRERIGPVLNFFCNNVHQFHLVRRIAPGFTACLVPEREALERYRASGARAIFFPMAANPAIYRPLDVPQSYEATFSGQRYADRAAAILALCRGGVDAKAFGVGWTPPRGGDVGGAGDVAGGGPLAGAGRALAATLRGRNPFIAARDRMAWRTLCDRHPGSVHGPVPDDEYIALFSRSKISLGFLVLGDTHRTRRTMRQVRLREFEGPMAGAFYLTGWLDELAEHYEIGREIVCYRSHAEMVDLCRHYLAHPEERERIRRAGHERALRSHTWRHRFEKLFDGLRGEGVLRAC